MKIGRIEKEKAPVQVRLQVPAALHERLTQYAAYYQHVHGEQAELKAIMTEMLRSMVDGDRDFQHWLKTQAARPASSGSSDGPRVSRRSQHVGADGCGDAPAATSVRA